MRQTSSPTLLGLIRGALRASYDEAVKEPLPERWVDLINHLNERESQQKKEWPSDQRRGTASCGAGTARCAFPKVGDLQALSPPADEDTLDPATGNPRRLTQLTSRTMDYPSEINVAQTKRLIGQARGTLAQLRGSLFHTQQLIDGSIQQMQEGKELLSRVGQILDLMQNRELLRSGTGDRANDPAKHRDPSRP